MSELYTNEKKIRKIGFIGTGPMSEWFAHYLGKEGYEVFLTGRTSEMRPEEMIPLVDVVGICVPISAAESVIRQYGKLLSSGQALITLAGETTNTINEALKNTSDGVEVMNVHPLFGPLATDMEGKNVIITKTERSNKLCEEFEGLFHKYDSNVTYDSPEKHDLMMGIEQKVPTALAIAFGGLFGSCMKEKGVTPEDIENHWTLTSIYPILQMARIHGQPSRTYAEILSSNKGVEILTKFRNELDKVIELSKKDNVESLEELIEKNAGQLGKEFLEKMLTLSKEVDVVLSKPRK